MVCLAIFIGLPLAADRETQGHPALCGEAIDFYRGIDRSSALTTTLPLCCQQRVYVPASSLAILTGSPVDALRGPRSAVISEDTRTPRTWTNNGNKAQDVTTHRVKQDSNFQRPQSSVFNVTAIQSTLFTEFFPLSELVLFGWTISSLVLCES